MTEENIGRPKTSIDLEELIEIASFYPSLDEISNWFNCSNDTIERTIKKHFNITFAEFRHKYSGKTRLAIKRKAISKALNENNDKLLIYCLRTMTDLDDRVLNDTNESTKENIIRLCYTEKDL
jgi:hypothetical protein